MTFIRDIYILNCKSYQKIQVYIDMDVYYIVIYVN